MIGKLALFALKKTPLIAGAVAAAWAGKKILDYIEESDVIKLTPNEVEERFPIREMLPVACYDFSEQKQNLAKIGFNKVMDDLDFLYISFFEYQGVLFTIQRYQQSKKYDYTVYVDFVSAARNKPDIDFFNIVEDLLTDLDFDSPKQVFKNTLITQFFPKWVLKNQTHTNEEVTSKSTKDLNENSKPPAKKSKKSKP